MAIGFFVVFLFSLDKFNEPSFSRRADEPETLFLPKFLALRGQYLRGLFLYVGGLEIFFILFSIAGPQIFNLNLPSAELAPEVWPLSAALIITGVIPSIKWLQKVEAKWRRLCHENAYIPDGAKETAHKITHARFDGSSYRSEIRSNPILNDVKDVFDSEDRVTRNWVKLSCILHILSQPDDEALSAHLDGSFLSASKNEIEQLTAEHKRALKLFRKYVTAKTAPGTEDTLSETSGELIRELRSLMRRSCTLLSCAVRLKKESERTVELALSELGFTIGSRPRPYRSLMDILFASFGGAFLIIFLGVYASQNMMSSTNVFREGYSRLDLTLLWAFLTLGFHGIAALVAGYLREQKLRRDTWTNRPLQKAGISLIGTIYGFIFLVIFTVATDRLGLSDLLHLLIWSPLPFVTAYCTLEFFGIRLGDNRLENGLRSALDGVLQGGITALTCVFASEAWIELNPKAPAGDAREWAKFVVLNVFVLGMSLGILLPAAYRRAGQLGDVEAVKERRERLEQLAAGVFPTQSERERWLKAPLKELDGASPIMAMSSFSLAARAEEILRRTVTLREA